MSEVTPSQGVALSIQAGDLKLSQIDRRMQKLGFQTPGRNGLRDIRDARRRLTLDEALALAWCLDTNPLALMLPSEPEFEGDPPYALRIGKGVALGRNAAVAWFGGRSVDDGTVVTLREITDWIVGRNMSRRWT